MPPKKLDVDTIEAALPAWAKALEGKTEAEIKALFPRLFALLEEASSFVSKPALKIISKVEGFRRGGIRHSVAETIHPIDAFNPVQIEQILNEDTLIVQAIEQPEEPAAQSDAGNADQGNGA